MSLNTQEFYVFGPFRLLVSEKLLLLDGRPVPLPPKAVETLLVLVERHGHLVTKDEMMQRIWPDTFVEEANLTTNISTLRRALAEGAGDGNYIETIPRRGYRFVAPVELRLEESAPMLVRERTRARIVVEENEDARPLNTEAGAAGLLPGWRRSKSRRLAAGAVLVLLVVAAALAWRFTASRSVLPFSQRDWVLVLDFENQTGEPRFDRALLTAFTASLEQSQHANFYARARIASVLKRMGKTGEEVLDELLGMEISNREGIRALVAGGITRAGTQYTLSARLIDPRSQTVARAFTARASGEEQILEALDNLAAEVRRGLGESLYAISRANRPLLQVTTPSLEALTTYTEGVEAWRAGRYKEAARFYGRALQLDPDFAMAHATLGAALLSHVLWEPEIGKKHLERALTLKDRVTSRERSRIEAVYMNSTGQYQEAVNLYRVYLNSHPDDLAEKGNLARLLMRMGRREDAIAQYREILRADSSDSDAHINLATSLNSLGRDEESLSYYEQAFEFEPALRTTPNVNHEYGFALVGAGKKDRARAVFTMALGNADAKNRALRSLALLDMYEGKYRAAAEKLEEAVRLEAGPDLAISRGRNHIFLAIVREGQGRALDRLRELDRAREALSAKQPPIWLSLRLGSLYARAGEVAKAARILEEHRTAVDPKDADANGALNWLKGELELAQGDTGRALEFFERASTLSSVTRILALPGMAAAFHKAGKIPQAIAAYERLLSEHDWPGWEPQHSWFAAHVELAHLYRSSGEDGKAAKVDRELRDAWKGGDPDLPLLATAR